MTHQQTCEELATQAQREAILKCIDAVRRTLPVHDDLSCCFGLRQNILAALGELLPGPPAANRDRMFGYDPSLPHDQ